MSEYVLLALALRKRRKGKFLGKRAFRLQNCIAHIRHMLNSILREKVICNVTDLFQSVIR